MNMTSALGKSKAFMAVSLIAGAGAGAGIAAYNMSDAVETAIDGKVSEFLTAQNIEVPEMFSDTDMANFDHTDGADLATAEPDAALDSVSDSVTDNATPDNTPVGQTPQMGM